MVDRDNGVQVVELDFPADLPATLLLNSPNFPESCLAGQFPGRVNVLQVLTYGPQVNAEELGDFLLIEPKRPGLIEHLDPDRPLLGLV
jgi:hypothetical protein